MSRPNGEDQSKGEAQGPKAAVTGSHLKEAASSSTAAYQGGMELVGRPKGDGPDQPHPPVTERCQCTVGMGETEISP